MRIPLMINAVYSLLFNVVIGKAGTIRVEWREKVSGSCSIVQER